MQTVLITGCSSGYGQATAEYFIQQGWNVIATMRRPGATWQDGERLRVLPLDVTDDASIAHAVHQGIAAFGRIDALVNNAGIGLLSAFEATPQATVRELFETNTFGTMAMARAVIAPMREQGHGCIINVTSSVCFAGMPMVAPYAASKWAIEGFTEALYYELESVGIRVRLVEPGYGPGTAFAANGAERMNGLVSQPYRDYAAQLMAQFETPGAVTTPAQVAAAVFAAATDTTHRLRFPAGPDSEHLAHARWNSTDEHFLSGMRAMLRMRAAA